MVKVLFDFKTKNYSLRIRKVTNCTGLFFDKEEEHNAIIFEFGKKRVKKFPNGHPYNVWFQHIYKIKVP